MYPIVADGSPAFRFGLIVRSGMESGKLYSADIS